MVNKSNADKYAKNNLENGGIAVLNVGENYKGVEIGVVKILKKDTKGKITQLETSLKVVF